MNDSSWAAVAEALPEVFNPDYDRIDGRIQLCDRSSGARVLFYLDNTDVIVKVAVPADPTLEARVRALIDTQKTLSFSRFQDPVTGELRPRETQVWQTSRAGENPAGEWSTGWRAYADYKTEIAAAVLTIMRDGLEMTVGGMCFLAADRHGPLDDMGLFAGKPVIPDRPSLRGVPTRCTQWPDFTRRLDWTLATLPQNSTVTLVAVRGTEMLAMVTFRMNGLMIEGRAMLGHDRTEDVRHRMSALGWRLDSMEPTPNWSAPEAWIGSVVGLQEFAHHTTAFFAELADVRSPEELLFFATKGLHDGPDPSLDYLDAELGLRKNSGE
ncbi:TY-Chap domain-containing protein [Nocardia sp. NPDC055321]